jgi:hypothetical protein
LIIGQQKSMGMPPLFWRVDGKLAVAAPQMIGDAAFAGLGRGSAWRRSSGDGKGPASHPAGPHPETWLVDALLRQMSSAW